MKFVDMKSLGDWVDWIAVREMGRKEEEDLPPRTQHDGPPDGAPTKAPTPQEITEHTVYSYPNDHSPMWTNF